MGCYNCGYLDPVQKKYGAVNGCLYYCKKNKTYINAATDNCEEYKNGYRNNYDNNEIYRNSDDYYDNDISTEVYLIVLIIMIITGLILGVFN